MSKTDLIQVDIELYQSKVQTRKFIVLIEGVPLDLSGKTDLVPLMDLLIGADTIPVTDCIKPGFKA